MDLETKRKWDRASKAFDLMNGYGPERRWAPFKRKLFSRMRGKILFVAVGTGLDVRFFPPGHTIVGLDISDKMLDKAKPRAVAYSGTIELRHLDVHDLDYPESTFDQIFTSCTFCSVPAPVEALRKLRCVLKPGGELHMFEHTGSRYFPFNVLLNIMNPFCRRIGPEVNRDTIGNVERAGFRITSVESVYLDVVKMIHATV